MTSITTIQKNLIERSETVGDIEYTKNNYDNYGNIINRSIPTITTNLCEIGLIDNNCYMTVILKSNQLNKKLYDVFKNMPDVYFYGLKNFNNNYSEFNEINNEQYVQIQFDFDINQNNENKIIDKYFEIKNIFINNDITPVNQLTNSLI